jgi:hypothetical protein
MAGVAGFLVFAVHQSMSNPRALSRHMFHPPLSRQCREACDENKPHKELFFQAGSKLFKVKTANNIPHALPGAL